jgi:hypothetical protein
MRALAVGLLAGMAVVQLVACGSDTPPGAAATSGAGGAVASAGSGGRAVPAGGNGNIAGNVEISDAGAGGDCSVASCGEGSRELTVPGQRCPVCAAICAGGFSCTAGGCPDGLDFIDVPQAGQCCPSCVVKSSGLGSAGAAGEGGADICAQALSDYEAYQSLLLNDGGLSCSSDIDCVLTNPMFTCGANCPIVVNETSAAEVNFQLGAAALDLCLHCPAPLASDCPPLKGALCVNQRCTSGTP